MMDTLKNFDQSLKRPGMLVARKAENWENTNFRPKESELLQNLLNYNQQTHVLDQVLIRNDNHALYYFDEEDSQMVLDKVAKDRKTKLNDCLLKCLSKAAKKLKIKEEILHLDWQKGSSVNSENDSKIIAYDLGKLHRRRLDSNLHLIMIPPLIEDKITVSFMVFANKLSIAVNGPEDIKDILLEMWIREINFQLHT